MPCAARVTVSELVVDPAPTSMSSPSTITTAGGAAPIVTGIVVAVALTGAVKVPSDVVLGTDIATIEPGARPARFAAVVFVATRLTVTIWLFANAPGKRALTVTVGVTAGNPALAFPLSAPGAKTRETYSLEPPLSKNALTLSAR